MKKFTPFLVTILLICCAFGTIAESASNEAAFSIRNGIRFGMSLDEVKNIEIAPIKRVDEDGRWIEYSPDKIVGQENAILEYIFNNDDQTLSAMYISFCSSTDNPIIVSSQYDKVNLPLIEKYGKPLGNRDGEISVYSSPLLESLSKSIAMNNWAEFDYKYDEWLLTPDDNTVIKIDHEYSVKKAKSKNAKRLTLHYIQYTLFTVNQYSDEI